MVKLVKSAEPVNRQVFADKAATSDSSNIKGDKSVLHFHLVSTDPKWQTNELMQVYNQSTYLQHFSL